MSDGDLTPRPLKIRKQRQRDVLIPTHRYNHENGLALLSLASTSRNTITGRTIIANDAIHRPATKTPIDSAPELHRQPSFKHRLLSRMMSGLTPRTQINDIDEEGEPTERELSTAKTSRDTSRSSAANSDRDAYGLNDLDNALAAFPTPPTSTVTSPATDRSFESIESQPPTDRELCKPLQNVTLAAELRVIPYQDHIKGDGTTLVAIEMSTTNTCLSEYELLPHKSAVDAAVIVDNSLFNSPASLMASCEIVRRLASFLDTGLDRMAVLCTVPAGTKQKDCNPTVVSSLSRIYSRRLKARLDSITISTTQPRPRALIAALNDAQQLLVKSEQLHSINNPLHDTFGHVFILTANINALCGEDLSHQTIQTHVLCSGLPHRKKWDEVGCNGWKLCIFNACLARDYPPYLTSKTDRDRHSLDNRLHTLVQHARLGKVSALLTDVVLDVQPRSGYSIEKTMGKSTYSKLQIGEVKTVIVKLRRTERPRSPSNTNALKWPNLDASYSGDDLMAELDLMLGLPKDGMITTKLRYKHSSLLVNTTCTTTAECLSQPPHPPKDKDLAGKSVSSKANILVHQRHAEFYATYYEPRGALLFLHREFGEGGSQSVCPTYISAIADELKYQARISERIAIQNSPQKSLSRRVEPHPGTSIKDFDMPALYYKHHRAYRGMNASDGEMIAPYGHHTNIAEQLGLDDARKIWNDLRTMSKGDRNENARKPSLSAAHQDRAKKITKTILRNKRSMSESTLRSVSMPVRMGSNGGLSAPWL